MKQAIKEKVTVVIAVDVELRELFVRFETYFLQAVLMSGRF